MKNRNRALKIAAVLSAVLLTLGGCKAKDVFSSGIKGEKEYKKAETMAIVTTERLRYEKVYSEKVWQAAVDNRGTTFEAALLEQIHAFLREVRLMSAMAKQENLTLSGKEKEQVQLAAAEYRKELGDVLAEELSISEKEMEELYTDYWLSEKLVEKLTEDANLEVSDSEAKVITVSQLEISQREAAEELLAKLQEEGADFTAVAKEYAENIEANRQLCRGEMGKEYEEEAFSLSEGGISGVVEDSGKFYILKCVDDYDEAATKLNKEKIASEKKNEAFLRRYQSFKGETPLTGEDPIWQEISISKSPRVTADFFEIFEQFCGDEGVSNGDSEWKGSIGG